MKIVFTRTPKPRAFKHVPIYYNPEEEDTKEKVEQALRNNGKIPNEGENYQSGIKRGSFRRNRFDMPEVSKDVRSQRKMSNIRLVLILLGMMLLGVILYMTSNAFLELT